MSGRIKGASLSELYGDQPVTIYRAVLASVTSFKPMDYVTKNLEWAKTHAQHTAAYEDAPAHVIMARVPADKVFEAMNLGELFYDGAEVKGKVIARFGEAKQDDPNIPKVVVTATSTAIRVLPVRKLPSGKLNSLPTATRLQLPSAEMTIEEFERFIYQLDSVLNVASSMAAPMGLVPATISVCLSSSVDTETKTEIAKWDAWSKSWVPTKMIPYFDDANTRFAFQIAKSALKR